MAQIFRIDNPLLGRGLSLMQRLCYTAATLHFFFGLPRLVFLLAPVAYPLFGLHVFSALPLAALAFFFPHVAQSTLASSRLRGRWRHSFWSEVYETCLAIYIVIPTTVALLAPRRAKFNVTAKGGTIERTFFEWRIAAPYLLLSALNLAGFAVGGARLWAGEGELDVLVVNLGWSAYNLVILAATIAAAWEQRQRRQSPRVALELPATVRLQGGRTAGCRTVDLSLSGCRLALPESWQPGPEASLAPGEPLHVSLSCAAGETPLPAELVGVRDGTLRVRFSQLSVEEHSALARALFSRADAWIGWRDPEVVDRPLASLATILGHGVGGLGRMLRAGFGGRAAEPAPLPASPPAGPRRLER
jgi:cellulose synthase (UDP-forming)